MPTRSGAQYIKHFDKTKDNTMPASTLNNSMASESYLIPTVLVAYAMVVWSSSSQLLHSHHTWVLLLLSIITQPVSMVVDALMLPHSLLLLRLLMLRHHPVLVGGLRPAVLVGPLCFPPALLWSWTVT
jgi:uncharacterized protein YceK